MAQTARPGLCGLAFRIRLALLRTAPLLPTLSPHQQGQQPALCLQNHFKGLPRGSPVREGPPGVSRCSEPPFLVSPRYRHISSTHKTSLPEACNHDGSPLHFSSSKGRPSWELQGRGRSFWMLGPVLVTRLEFCTNLCGQALWQRKPQWFPGRLVS